MDLGSGLKILSVAYWLAAAYITVKKLRLRLGPSVPEIVGRLAFRIWALVRDRIEGLEE